MSSAWCPIQLTGIHLGVVYPSEFAITLTLRSSTFMSSYIRSSFPLTVTKLVNFTGQLKIVFSSGFFYSTIYGGTLYLYYAGKIGLIVRSRYGNYKFLSGNIYGFFLTFSTPKSYKSTKIYRWSYTWLYTSGSFVDKNQIQQTVDAYLASNEKADDDNFATFFRHERIFFHQLTETTR